MLDTEIPDPSPRVPIISKPLYDDQNDWIELYPQFSEETPGGDYKMCCHEGEDETVTLKNLAATMDNEIKFVLAPALAGDFTIANSDPAASGVEDQYLSVKICMSTSSVYTMVTQTVSVGSEIDPDKYGSYSTSCAYGNDPSHNSFNFLANTGTINQEGNLVLTVRTEYTGLPTSFYFHTGGVYDTQLSFQVIKDLNLDVTAVVNQGAGSVHVSAAHDNPLGNAAVNHSKTQIEWSGPTDPATVQHEAGTLVWIWDFDSDEAESGSYSISITIEDIQFDTATDVQAFTIEGLSDDDSSDDDEDRDDPTITIVVVIAILIIILLIITYWLIKRKKE